MTIDLRNQLLKKVLWYQPREVQKLVIPMSCMEEVQRLKLESENSTICGINFIYKNSKEVELIFDFDNLNPNNDDRPIMPIELLQYKHAGIIGYGLQHVMDLVSNHEKFKKNVYKLMNDSCSIFYCNYSPSKISSTLNWGLELISAYLSAKEGLEVDLYVSTCNKQVPYNWDLQSKLMASELLTELEVNIIEKPSRHLCRLSTLKSCDYLVYDNIERDNDQFVKIAKESNKPIIRMTGWQK